MRVLRSVSPVSVFVAAGLLAGCGTSQPVNNPGGGGSVTTATLATGGATNLYAAVNNSTPVIVGYNTSTSGTPIPSLSFNISALGVVEAIAVDKSTGTTYVALDSSTDAQPEILAFSAGASGTPTPVRTILTGYPTTTDGVDLTTDVSGNVYLAVQDQSGLATILEYGPTATGAATPLKAISGTATGIVNPLSVVVDSAGTIYVSSFTANAIYSGAILEFAASATGNVAPLRTITNSSALFYGLAVDASFNVYAAQETYSYSIYYGGTVSNIHISEFAAGATGAATPTKTLYSSAMNFLYGMTIDSVGNLYVLNGITAGSDLLGFGPTGSGNVNPGLTLTPTALNVGTTSSIAAR